MSAFILFANVDSQTTASWVDAVGTWFAAVGTIFVAVAAFFPELVRGLILRPKCVLECGDSDVLWHRLRDHSSGTDWRQIRLRVLNNGNTTAREIEVHLLGVSKLNDNVPKEVSGFVPARLKWTHGGPLTKPYLAPGTSALIDFGSLSPRPITALLSLNVEVEGLDLWNYRGGIYHFDLAVSSSTGFLKRMIFQVSFDPYWYKEGVYDANFSIKPIHDLALS